MIYCLLPSCPWFLEYFFFAKHVKTVRKLVHICSLHVTVMQILKTHFLNFSTIGLENMLPLESNLLKPKIVCCLEKTGAQHLKV